MSLELPFRVVIAGGGVAALEAALALQDLAGTRVAVRLVAPNAELTYRPMRVVEPFAYRAAHHYSLADAAAQAGAELIPDRLAWVDVPSRSAHTAGGVELEYDALLLALGARMRPALPRAVTIDDARMDELLHGIVQDVEGGYLHSLAFVAPARMAWPLPIYELALMTARRAYDMNAEVDITVITPESEPLAIFGEQASRAVAGLLADAGITVIGSARVWVPEEGHIVIQPGDRRLAVERVIALPELYGPSMPGIPKGPHGFFDIDSHGHVEGAPHVFAAGDATSFAVKHGGIAAQQADTAAESIAALAGVPLTPAPFRPRIDGVLLTGAKPKYLTAQVTGGRGFRSEISDEPVAESTAKIAARYLGPYLAGCDLALAAK